MVRWSGGQRVRWSGFFFVFFNASLSKLVSDFFSLGFFAQDFFWIISKEQQQQDVDSKFLPESVSE